MSAGPPPPPPTFTYSRKQSKRRHRTDESDSFSLPSHKRPNVQVDVLVHSPPKVIKPTSSSSHSLVDERAAEVIARTIIPFCLFSNSHSLYLQVIAPLRCPQNTHEMYLFREALPREQVAFPPIRGASLRVSIFESISSCPRLNLAQRINLGRPLAHPLHCVPPPVLRRPHRRRTIPSGHLSNQRLRYRHHLLSHPSPLLS